jgi:hypothetical protein
MRLVKSIAVLSLLCLIGPSSSPVPAQIGVGVGVNIGPEPVCPYGYFDYAPYDCAPSGYYGPDWFLNGLFIGVGPWFHGTHGFYGHVDNRYDPRNGYRGPLPRRGERPFNGFRANEARDGNGHTGTANHDGGREHSPGFSGRGGVGGRGGGRR